LWPLTNTELARIAREQIRRRLAVLELRWSFFYSLIWPISWFIVSFQFNHRSSLGSSGPAFLLLAGALLVGSAPVKALTVTPSVDANAMAIALLGPGVSLVPGSAVYTGASNSSGFFAGDTTIFGDLAGAKGVLLTSGAVTNALPPNDFPNASQDNGLLGSADLDALVGGDTLDASVLSFKVKLDPGTSGIQWKYSFGSEEYLEYVGLAELPDRTFHCDKDGLISLDDQVRTTSRLMQKLAYVAHKRPERRQAAHKQSIAK
jgi:hypothetical protein